MPHKTYKSILRKIFFQFLDQQLFQVKRSWTSVENRVLRNAVVSVEHAVLIFLSMVMVDCNKTVALHHLTSVSHETCTSPNELKKLSSRHCAKAIQLHVHRTGARPMATELSNSNPEIEHWFTDPKY